LAKLRTKKTLPVTARPRGSLVTRTVLVSPRLLRLQLGLRLKGLRLRQVEGTAALDSEPFTRRLVLGP